MFTFVIQLICRRFSFYSVRYIHCIHEHLSCTYCLTNLYRQASKFKYISFWLNENYTILGLRWAVLVWLDCVCFCLCLGVDGGMDECVVQEWVCQVADLLITALFVFSVILGYIEILDEMYQVYNCYSSSIDRFFTTE